MFKKRVAAAFMLISSLALAAAPCARAQSLASARVLSSEGPVEIQRRAQGQAAVEKISFRPNDELLAGDLIKTFKGGRLVLGLTDGSQAIVGENTTVEINDLSKNPRTIFNVLRGKTRVHIEKLGGRPNPYRVNTPTAVIAVRGTIFDVLVSKTETQVFVHEGEVSVNNLSLPDQPVVLSPGQRTQVEPQRPPAPPTAFQPGRNDDAFRPHQGDGGRDPRDAGRGAGPNGAGDHNDHGPGRGPGGQPGASQPGDRGRPPEENTPDGNSPSRSDS